VAARFATLDAWLAWQERLHPTTIDLGLDRVRRVLGALGLAPFACPVITIGGTNGKGSCVALLESILRAEGLKVGAFTSPHLIRYNERIHIDGREAADDELMTAFERITDARRDVSLTFFEYNTLAALCLFAAARLDAIILEVGMGGRLDAVNAIDPDAALIVSVGIDHVEWLGRTVADIGREKAGILRAGRPAVLGSSDMPDSVRSAAHLLGAQLIEPGRDFHWQHSGVRWSWQGRTSSHTDLPRPALAGVRQFDNASAVLAVLEAIGPRLPAGHSAIARGLETVQLAGRNQRVDRAGVEWVLDVAHNVAAAVTLALNLDESAPTGRTIAVYGALKDKDVAAIVRTLATHVDEWLLVDVPGERGLDAAELSRRAFAGMDARVASGGLLSEALDTAERRAQRGDCVVVFGSFQLVGPALEWLRLYSRAPLNPTLNL
jgi:dihydrofolate synthase/folylpolyglutamate synthase